ncbi:double-strand break repair helicase AddA [Pseudochelatococcus sp. G4_1912]|uniref:double-strand break repair helicase AddA n=1 Tax=Pseudochelatococcus sp. G4_1912 TaxID=3114288 RepID=UPI0039C73C03
MSGIVVPAKTGHDQRRAADPSASAWVSANAGSGKTKVLADRVLRLLLDGVDPARILCLTFTKAAAANMSNRVFDELGAWVALDDATLARKLEALDGASSSPKRIAIARRLFARAVETPGGLKIETIHAFCERLLHLFPFEANVPARFEVLDEAQSQELLEQATREVLIGASLGRDPLVAQCLTYLAHEAGDDTVNKVLRAALRHKPFLRDYARGAEGLTRVLDAFGASCGLGVAETPAYLRRIVVEGGIQAQEWPGIATELDNGSKTDKAKAEALRAAYAATREEERFILYRDIFFTQTGSPLKSMATKAIDVSLAERLLEEQDRVVSVLERLKVAEAIARTKALFTLADAVFGRLEALKNARGALDFDDLIARTVSLLQRADAAWILYKLDAGIDHVLVDEAQDTSPDQWIILKTLVEEFAAGEGAFPRRRTLFAVGDPKQSIYGFQGAAPYEFEASGRHFRNRTVAADMRFEDVQLTVSFRSAPEILSAVDAVFALPAHRKGLSFDDGASGPVHESARPSSPGVVEVWPTEWKVKAVDTDAWSLPVDEPEASAPAVRLARKVARTIRRWMNMGDENGQLIQPGEVLILVRKRSVFFEAVIRALKDEHVPVAGADRLTVAQHIGVRDLVAAGRAALQPYDDLTLAAALKSPLVGWSDDDLMRIAAPRAEGVSLIEAIHQAAEAADAAAVTARSKQAEWRELAALRGPFGFYATLLGPLGGRRALVARLGAEAGDAIDSFLALALDYERRLAPSLTGFLNAFEGATRDIKRDMDDARNEVRVMTVHGAKGLEAPVVILADGGEKPDGSHDPLLIEVAVEVEGETIKIPVWSPSSKADPTPVAEARALLREKAAEENNRLLYVALTRAKNRLIVASGINKEPPGADDSIANARPSDDCWSGMVINGLEQAVSEPTGTKGRLVCVDDGDGREVLRWFTPEKSPAMPAVPSSSIAPVFEAPVWLMQPARTEAESAPPLRPSSALSAADQPHRPADAPIIASARLRGQLVHALIERLPAFAPEARVLAANGFVAARAGRLPVQDQRQIIEAAIGVLSAPALQDLFGPQSQAEVAVAGNVILGDGTTLPISGRIDRLAIAGDEVHIADFKSGTPSNAQQLTGTVQQAHVAQLALYYALLRQIMPEKRIRTFLIYTVGPTVIEVPAAELETALQQKNKLDVFPGGYKG